MGAVGGLVPRLRYTLYCSTPFIVPVASDMLVHAGMQRSS